MDWNKVCRSLSSCLGCAVIWKDCEGAALSGLERRFSAHLNDYCAAVKSDSISFRNCLYEDTVGCFTALRKVEKPYVKICHAGVCDLVIPGMAGDRLAGFLLVGSGKTDRGTINPIRNQYRSLYEMLPPFNEDALMRHRELLKLVACSLAEHHASQMHAEELESSHPKILIARKYVSSRLAEELTLDRVAHHCCMSRSRLTALFRQELGVSFTEYVRQRRIERAKLLLATTASSLDRIAQKSGFASQSYFSSVFRRQTGMTPLKYRTKKQRAMWV